MLYLSDYEFLRKSSSPTLPASSTLHVVDLFCGCGGLSLGAMEAFNDLGRGFLCVAALDRDFHALETYCQNLPCKNKFHSEIQSIVDGFIGSDTTKHEKAFLDYIGNVDFLLAGPPCQGYSNLNNHTRRDDVRNLLYERVARFVEIARPENVLIENVPAAILGKEKSVQMTIQVMTEAGYNIDSEVVNLAAIGVPQRRKRHIVVASLSTGISIKEVVARWQIDSPRTVKWAIGDIVNEQPTKLYTTPSCLSKANMGRIEYMFNHNIYDLPDFLRPFCHQNGHSYQSMYGRMKENEPSQTITSGFNSPGQGRFIHPTKKRTLTPHESARLQFFPDYFDFSKVGTRESLTNMIGNAVPMKLSYIFCLSMLGWSP